MNRPAITALITIQEINTSDLPDAHVKDFAGQPLFRLMIEKLLAVKSIDRIVITTDSPKVRTMYGSNNRIQVIDLPGPETLSADTPANILEEMPTSDRMTGNSLEKIKEEHFLQTQCINPLLSVRTIEEVIERYYKYVLNQEEMPEEYRFDSVMSLRRIEKRLYDSSNYPTIKLRDEPHFVVFEDTVFNVFNRTAFLRNKKKKFGKNPMFFEVPEIESLAVETPVSYKLAKLAYANQAEFF